MKGAVLDRQSNETTRYSEVVLSDIIQQVHSPAMGPSDNLYVIGITGTNGKTTVAHLIGEVLRSAGYHPYVLGTLNSGNRDLSTPELKDTLRLMEQHLEDGGTHFVMEVTSEGIDQARVRGIHFDVKVLTNITQDHLDYHKTIERYRNAKLSFMMEGSGFKIFPDQFKQENIGFTTQLLGEFNHLNIQAAASVLRHVGISEHYIQASLSSCLPPKGRLENIELGQPFMVLVDYAHTTDGLENVLGTVKQIAEGRSGRLLVMFGCGGDRDCEKRPLMGKIASTLADVLVITDDNPRSESCSKITAEIIGGISRSCFKYSVIHDRKTAIEYIINYSRPRDVVILIGKGHEAYQILKDKVIHFDDVEVATSTIRSQICAEA